VTDPIATSKGSGEHERPTSVEAVQRRAERSQRGIEAPAMSVNELQLAGYEIERTPGERLDERTTIGWPRVASGAGERPIHIEGGGH
jgi:hypothetical protein